MNDLAPLVDDARSDFASARSPAELENAKARYLGKSGRITEQLKALGTLAAAAKKERGALINVAGVGLLGSAANPDSALTFVQYLLSDEAQVYFAEETSEYPVVAGIDWEGTDKRLREPRAKSSGGSHASPPPVNHEPEELPVEPEPPPSDSEIIAGIIKREGGYVDHPADRGGPTKYGVTLATLQDHRAAPVTAADVEALTESEAASIYRERYLLEPGFDRIQDDRLRALVLDCSVLHGQATATKLLQRAIGLKDDGVFGAKTEAAANITPRFLP